MHLVSQQKRWILHQDGSSARRFYFQFIEFVHQLYSGTSCLFKITRFRSRPGTPNADERDEWSWAINANLEGQILIFVFWDDLERHVDKKEFTMHLRESAWVNFPDNNIARGGYKFLVGPAYLWVSIIHRNRKDSSPLAPQGRRVSQPMPSSKLKASDSTPDSFRLAVIKYFHY